jgi:hypothetical protein
MCHPSGCHGKNGLQAGAWQGNIPQQPHEAHSEHAHGPCMQLPGQGSDSCHGSANQQRRLQLPRTQCTQHQTWAGLCMERARQFSHECPRSPTDQLCRGNPPAMDSHTLQSMVPWWWPPACSEHPCSKMVPVAAAWGSWRQAGRMHAATRAAPVQCTSQALRNAGLVPSPAVIQVLN